MTNIDELQVRIENFLNASGLNKPFKVLVSDQGDYRCLTFGRHKINGSVRIHAMNRLQVLWRSDTKKIPARGDVELKSEDDVKCFIRKVIVDLDPSDVRLN